MHFVSGRREDFVISQPREATPSKTRGSHYGHLISNGLELPLHDVPFHKNATAPLNRRVLIGEGISEEACKRVVAHEIHAVSAAQRGYCQPHIHDCPEINLILSLNELRYEIVLGDETYQVEAPASIYIPAKLPHSANVIAGSGFFIAMIETADYVASSPTEPITRL